jgi:hypothetical protein
MQLMAIESDEQLGRAAAEQIQRLATSFSMDMPPQAWDSGSALADLVRAATSLKKLQEAGQSGMFELTALHVAKLALILASPRWPTIKPETRAAELRASADSLTVEAEQFLSLAGKK